MMFCFICHWYPQQWVILYSWRSSSHPGASAVWRISMVSLLGKWCFHGLMTIFLRSLLWKSCNLQLSEVKIHIILWFVHVHLFFFKYHYRFIAKMGFHTDDFHCDFHLVSWHVSCALTVLAVLLSQNVLDKWCGPFCTNRKQT